jgi:hypothetical protein
MLVGEQSPRLAQLLNIGCGVGAGELRYSGQHSEERKGTDWTRAPRQVRYSQCAGRMGGSQTTRFTSLLSKASTTSLPS